MTAAMHCPDEMESRYLVSRRSGEKEVVIGN
jgi:hypothetical protein